MTILALAACVCPASDDTSKPAIDFDTQVIPVLTRHGCNAGACHGAAIGRGGFKLSLFGSRASDDHLSIVRELEGRRINLHHPQDSLLLRKATETTEHGGGQRFDESSSAHTMLAAWIADGGKRVQRRQLTHLAVSPTNVLLDAPGTSVTVSVTATFDDGTHDDVTSTTVFTSDDPDSVAIQPDSNQLHVKRRGEHVIIARYLGHVEAITIAVPVGESEVAETPPTTQNDASISFIDQRIDDKLRRLRIPASPQAGDEEFARRVWLDLTGQLPPIDELDAFVIDDSPEKRRKLIDRLLETDAFAAYWALKWANVVGIDSKQLQPQGNAAFHQWLHELFQNNASWKQAAIAMLTGNGDSFVDGNINFLRLGNGPDGLAESATRVLMGVRLRCANCHDHPLDHWTQDDYHGLAAIFARLNRGQIVSVSKRGEVTHPVTGQPAIPRIPGTRFLTGEEDGRLELSRWLTDDSNPYFARAVSNRVWAQLMGRGLIDPVDDIRATNPPSHPELLDELANFFAHHEYRFGELIRLICNSQAYARTSMMTPENESDYVYYSHFLKRGLEAEVVANLISDVTGVAIHFGDERTVDAIRLTDNQLPSETLETLGRCDRSEACETPGLNSSSLAKVLHFLNGDLLNQRLTANDGSLRGWLQTYDNDSELIEVMYRRTLSRRPRAPELHYWSRQWTDAKEPNGQWRDPQERREFFADVFWGLLSSETFLTNH